jgi:hypothetical protein
VKRWLVAGGVVFVLFAALVTLTALLPESPDRTSGSITNPRPAGVRALGQVLAADGVHVTQVTSLEEAADTGPDATLAVYLAAELSEEALSRLSDVPADVVVVHASGSPLDSVLTLTDGLVSSDYWWAADEHPRAGCADPDAVAAGTISPAGVGLYAESDRVTTCFVGEEDTALYADTSTNSHRVTVVAGSDWVRNDTITSEGNAALALRVFGRHPSLVWYLPGADALAQPSQWDDPTGSGFDAFSLLPPWSRTVLAMLLVAGAAAALWRGRRFGALVRENLPVEVPASEVSSGLARLYRQAGARGHAAAGLRAAAIHRVAGRLGLSANASPDLVVERLAGASGEASDQVRALCYGPPPTSDTDLVALATALTDLERKVSSRD